MLYANSANHTGLDPARVGAYMEKLSLALNNRGCDAHEIRESNDPMEILGVYIEGRAEVVRPTDERRRRLFGSMRSQLHDLTSRVRNSIKWPPPSSSSTDLCSVSSVTTTDASLSGFAACETDCSACDFENAGTWYEWWRFRPRQDGVPHDCLDSSVDPSQFDRLSEC